MLTYTGVNVNCESLGSGLSCGGSLSCGSLSCRSYSCGLFSVYKDGVCSTGLLCGIPVSDIELECYVAGIVLRLNVEENVLTVVLRRISLVELSFGILYKTPVDIPTAVSSKLELIFCVGINIFVGDLINAGLNFCHSVLSSSGIPGNTVKEVALTCADSSHVADVVYGRNYAVAVNIDLTGLGIVCNSYVTILCEHEVIVEVCAVHAVPYSVSGVAADELNNLNLIESAFLSSYIGYCYLVEAVSGIKGHSVGIGIG